MSDLIKDAVLSEILDLKPSPYNPRTIKPESMEALRASLKKFGLVQPLVANKRTLNVIGGHQRLEVLREEGILFAPVVWLDLTEEEEQALNLQLNAISGDWDYNKLVPMMKNLKSKAWDVNQMGFDFATTEALLAGTEAGATTTPGMTPAQRKAIYDANVIKQIVIYFQAAEYLEVLSKLKTILGEQKLETHTDVFLFLLNEYEKNRSQASVS